MYEKRIIAKEMRRKGASVTEIRIALGVSKSTASLWCRDIALSEHQRERLIKKSLIKTLRGRLMGAQVNKQKRIDAIADADQYGRSALTNITPRELLVAGTALYWAEGSKSMYTSGFQFINSDPEMILIIKKFLRSLGIKNENICCTIQINETHRYRIDVVLKYWKKLLDLSDEQVGNTSFIRTKLGKVYDNHEAYFGICRLRVKKSTALKYKMLGLIKAFKISVLSG